MAALLCCRTGLTVVTITHEYLSYIPVRSKAGTCTRGCSYLCYSYSYRYRYGLRSMQVPVTGTYGC